MKKLLTGMLTAVMAVTLFAGCSPASSQKGEEITDKWADIEKRGSIIMGLDDTFVPMGYKNEKGEFTGFDVELAREAVKRIGLEVKFQPIDWNLKETELNSGNIDLIWNGYTINDERKEKVNFTSPYLDNRQIIVVLSGSDIKDKASLKDRAVATQNSSSSLEAIKSEGADKTFKGGEPVLFDTYPDAFRDLEAGRVDAVVADEVLARYYIGQKGEEKYTVLSDDFGDEEYGVGVRKGDKILLEKLNAALDEMKKDGAAAAVSEKWFKENIVK